MVDFPAHINCGMVGGKIIHADHIISPHQRWLGRGLQQLLSRLVWNMKMQTLRFWAQARGVWGDMALGQVFPQRPK